jgi:hypothetical protein
MLKLHASRRVKKFQKNKLEKNVLRVEEKIRFKIQVVQLKAYL